MDRRRGRRGNPDYHSGDLQRCFQGYGQADPVRSSKESRLELGIDQSRETVQENNPARQRPSRAQVEARFQTPGLAGVLPKPRSGNRT